MSFAYKTIEESAQVMSRINAQGRYCQRATSLGTKLPGDILAVILMLQATSLAGSGVSTFQPPYLTMQCMRFYIDVSEVCH